MCGNATAAAAFKKSRRWTETMEAYAGHSPLALAGARFERFYLEFHRKAERRVILCCPALDTMRLPYMLRKRWSSAKVSLRRCPSTHPARSQSLRSLAVRRNRDAYFR